MCCFCTVSTRRTDGIEPEHDPILSSLATRRSLESLVKAAISTFDEECIQYQTILLFMYNINCFLHGMLCLCSCTCLH
jgi:hypothetical protein